MMLGYLMAASSINNNSFGNNSLTLEELNDEIEANKIKRQEKLISNKLKKGLSEFRFGGKVIIALNQKSAEKKAKKLGLI